MEDDELVIPVKSLHNYVYCPRLMYFQLVEKVLVYNADMVEGDSVHARIDVPTPAEYPGELFADGRETVRSLSLTDQGLGISGVVDLLRRESDDGWTVYDYKHGSPRKGPGGAPLAKEADALQLEAYAYLAGKVAAMPCVRGRIFYAETRSFAEVPIPVDFSRVRQVVAAVRKAVAEPLPEPLADDVRCLYCSLYPVCLPDESRYWKRQGKLTTPARPPLADDDPGEMLVAQDPRAWIGKRGDTVTVSVGGEAVSTHPLHRLRSIFIYGSAQISTQLLTTCLKEGIAVSFFSPAGKYLGRADAFMASGLDSRYGQYRMAENEALAVRTAAQFIRGKISNQRTLLLRNLRRRDAADMARLAELRRRTTACRTRDELQGLEGKAAAIYFTCFAGMLHDDYFAASFVGRNRRPPRDPVNAMLSLGYSVLSSEIAGICAAVGLDPACGLLHAPRFGRPALALDLMEEFRPLIVDSVVVSLVNRGGVGKNDFVFSSQGCAMRKSGHQAFWGAYARRMAEELIHPAFHYRMTYRRLLEIQVRQLWRVFRGAAGSYHPIITR